MSSFDPQKALYSKQFFRFTGPPENWLTAIKYMTWGLEEKNISTWQKINPGDVFFMHSTVTSTKYKNTRSSIVGLGVVGTNLKRKENFLWVKEMETQQNIWPLLVPFSEIYLFSDLPDSGTWEAPGFNKNNSSIQNLINLLLKKSIDLSVVNKLQLTGPKFPVMGSASSVSQEPAKIILKDGLPNLFRESPVDVERVNTTLAEITTAEATMRYVPTLKFLEKIKPKVLKKSVSYFEKDNSLLERAEEEHASILQKAIDFFRGNGFKTYSNVHVDLFAVKGDNSFLIEAKSMSHKNFRSQARKAIAQLFEYEYFDIKDFTEAKKMSVNKIMLVGKDPNESDYTDFLNFLDIYLAMINGDISFSGEKVKVI